MNTIYALDSNTVSFLLRPSRNSEVVKKFEETISQGYEYVIPPLCYYEVYWYLLRKRATSQLEIFRELYENSKKRISICEEEIIKAAEIRATLEERGQLIGSNDADIFIAAHCIIGGYTLVTDNESDFNRIGELSFVNWKG